MPNCFPSGFSERLWRNVVFAEWMADVDRTRTKAYVVNLTRAGVEEGSCELFQQLLCPAYRDRFMHWTWEQIHALTVHHPELSRLRYYLETKTAGLLPAFRLGRDRPC